MKRARTLALVPMASQLFMETDFGETTSDILPKFPYFLKI